MRKIALLLLVAFGFTITGCATLTGKAKPKQLVAKTSTGYEDRDEMAHRNSIQSGIEAEFDNGHTFGIDYRWRESDGNDENAVFISYSFPIWKATEGGAWGEGKWINPLDMDTIGGWMNKD